MAQVMLKQVALVAIFAGMAAAQGDAPTYSVTTLVRGGPQARSGDRLYLAQGRQANRLFATGGHTSLVYEFDLTEGSAAVYAGQVTGHQDSDRLGGAAFFKPGGVCLDPDTGDILVADTGNAVIRLVDAQTGWVSTVAGSPGVKGKLDGVGNAARFSSPLSIACLPGGAALVGDPGLQALRLLKREATSAAGLGTLKLPREHQGASPTSSQAAAPVFSVNTLLRLATTASHGAFFDLATDPGRPGRVLVSDMNTTVWEVPNINDPAGLSLKVLAGDPSKAPGHKDGPVEAATFQRLGGLCVTPAGHVVVTDTGSATVRLIHATTGEVVTVAGQPNARGTADGPGVTAQFMHPADVVCLADGRVLVGDGGVPGIRQLSCTSNCGPAPAPTPSDEPADDHPDASGGSKHAGVIGGVVVGAGLISMLMIVIAKWSSVIMKEVPRRIARLREHHLGRAASGDLSPTESGYQPLWDGPAELPDSPHVDLLGISQPVDLLTHHADVPAPVQLIDAMDEPPQQEGGKDLL